MRGFRTFLAFIAVAALSGAAMAQPKLQTLNVIVFPGGWNLPIWAAERQGFFEQNGLRIVVTPTPSSTFQMQGFAEGRFDIAMTAIDNIVAYQEGQGEAKIPANPDMFAFMGGDSGFLSLVGAKDVRRIAELKGKKLSVDAMTTGYAFVLRELLARSGIAESDVTFERAGGGLQRFQALLKGDHAGTMLIAPFDILAINQGHTRLAKADEHLGAYQGVVGGARRSWAKDNEAALLGFIRAYHAGVQYVVDPKNRDIAEALLVALAGRTMTPQLAKQAADTLLDPKSGFIRDAALNMQGISTVLQMRSKFTGKQLGDASKYVDPSYRDKALAR